MNGKWWAVLLLVVSGCVHAPYVAGRRTPPGTVQGVVHTEERVAGARGTPIFRQAWKPEGEPRAALVIVHGLKDYGDRYASLAQELVQKGFAVYAIDLRGHGDSEGDRVWVDEFDDYVKDVDSLVRTAQLENKGKKVFLFGHSMGGAIATRLALLDETRVDGLVLSAPAIALDVGGGTRFFVGILGTIAPTLALLELDDAKFSRDPNVVTAMAKDPLIFEGKGPARTAQQLFWVVDENADHLRELKLPLLLLHGDQDQVTSPAGSKLLYGLAQSSDKTLKIYPGLVHDLLHEPESAQVRSDLVGWLASHAQ